MPGAQVSAAAATQAIFDEQPRSQVTPVGSLSATSSRGNPPLSHHVPQHRQPLQHRKYCHYRICSNQLASRHNLYLSVKLFKLITFSKIIRLIGNLLMQPCLVLFQSVAKFSCARLVRKERNK